MTTYDFIIFDLDGVIIDQREGIVNSVKYALSKLGIDETDNEKLLSFIGPPLKDSFKKYYSFNEEKTMEAVRYYRENYSKTGVYEFKLYNGTSEMLSLLKKENKKLFVATTKPKFFADKVLTQAKIHGLFDKIYGDTLTFDVTKTLMIKMIIEDNKLVDLSKVVMVGDRDSDVFAAKNNHINSVGVTYGFGSREELEKANATIIVNSVNELKEELRKIN